MPELRKTILFIDDEAYHMSAHAEYLTLDGFDVIYVSAFDEAFEEAKRNLHLIDLVILDIMIPIEDADLDEDETRLADQGAGAGLVLYDRIKKLRDDIKTIVLTVRNDIEHEIKERGVEEWIVKP
ncbi:response regulator transcription factor, partial [bacterium]|nr:response regulator transcription factor [bacterium]